jgi:hypothetical protein
MEDLQVLRTHYDNIVGEIQRLSSLGNPMATDDVSSSAALLASRTLVAIADELRVISNELSGIKARME